MVLWCVVKWSCFLHRVMRGCFIQRTCLREHTDREYQDFARIILYKKRGFLRESLRPPPLGYKDSPYDSLQTDEKEPF